MYSKKRRAKETWGPHKVLNVSERDKSTVCISSPQEKAKSFKPWGALYILIICGGLAQGRSHTQKFYNFLGAQP